MDFPVLPYDPRVDDFGSRILTSESGESITYEEAFQNSSYVEEALQNNATGIPVEFTMFVLRKMAVHEKDFRSFERALPDRAREYLRKLIGLKVEIRLQKHAPAYGRDEAPTSFRGALVKVFCKKVITNFVPDQEDLHYDKCATVFPFKVSGNVPEYENDVFDVFQEDFFHEMQHFLDQHFLNVDAREIVKIFLNHIRHNRNQRNLNNVRRLNNDGIERFKFLYKEFNNVRKCFNISVPNPEFYEEEQFNDEYFRNLPDNNLADLYSFLERAEYSSCAHGYPNYMEKFQKYLFFFIYALQVATETDPNPVFFIDDMLFECMKSLRKYKRVREDITLVKDLAKIALLHSRLDPSRRSEEKYYLNERVFEKIKTYISESIVPNNPRLNVCFRTELIGWMPFRTDNACFNECYSRVRGIKDFYERVLCSVLCPENDPVEYVVQYNAFLGVENRFKLPRDVQSLKNFVRLCNTYDVSNEDLRESNDHFINVYDSLLD